MTGTLSVSSGRKSRNSAFAFPDIPGYRPVSRVQNLFEFDDVYTAPRNGFRDAAEYYDCE